MKLSLVTVSKNSERTIEQTIQSVLSQSYPNIEYIFIDGGSTDGTVDIIKKYEDRVTYWVSEPDSGIYDAMNKGIKKATGDIVGILNTDDFYANEKVLEKVVQCFEKDKEVDACYGDLVYVKKNNPDKIVRYWKTGEYKEKLLKYGWMPPHPTLFVRRDVYDRCGLFRTDFSIAADYEFILRILKKCKVKIAYIPEVLVHMRSGGESGRSLGQRIKAWRELYTAWKVNSLRPPFFLVLTRVISKLPQLYKKQF